MGRGEPFVSRDCLIMSADIFSSQSQWRREGEGGANRVQWAERRDAMKYLTKL